jgi:hypothetical protein
VQDGQPFVIPTAFGRVGEKLYLHGHSANHLLKTMKARTHTPLLACCTCTLACSVSRMLPVGSHPGMLTVSVLVALLAHTRLGRGSHEVPFSRF